MYRALVKSPEYEVRRSREQVQAHIANLCLCPSIRSDFEASRLSVVLVPYCVWALC